MAELENPSEKRLDEEDSEEDSNTDEDEVIPDIGTSMSGGDLWGFCEVGCLTAPCSQLPVWGSYFHSCDLCVQTSSMRVGCR